MLRFAFRISTAYQAWLQRSRRVEISELHTAMEYNKKWDKSDGQVIISTIGRFMVL